jgi:hypothetical protein
LKEKQILICIVLIPILAFGTICYLEALVVNRAFTSLTTFLSSSTITYGSKVTITAAMSQVLQGKSVTIQSSIDSTTWYNLSSGTTNSAGQYSYLWAPDAGSYYLRSTWSGDTNYHGATSTSQQLTVNRAATSTMCMLSSDSINYGANVTVAGTVSVVVNDETMTLQYSADNLTWNNISSGTPSTGSYSFNWSPPALGTYYVRAVWSGDQNYQAYTGASRTLTVLSRCPGHCFVQLDAPVRCTMAMVRHSRKNGIFTGYLSETNPMVQCPYQQSIRIPCLLKEHRQRAKRPEHTSNISILSNSNYKPRKLNHDNCLIQDIRSNQP